MVIIPLTPLRFTFSAQSLTLLIVHTSNTSKPEHDACQPFRHSHLTCRCLFSCLCFIPNNGSISWHFWKISCLFVVKGIWPGIHPMAQIRKLWGPVSLNQKIIPQVYDTRACNRSLMRPKPSFAMTRVAMKISTIIISQPSSRVLLPLSMLLFISNLQSPNPNPKYRIWVQWPNIELETATATMMTSSFFEICLWSMPEFPTFYSGVLELL